MAAEKESTWTILLPTKDPLVKEGPVHFRIDLSSDEEKVVRSQERAFAEFLLTHKVGDRFNSILLSQLEQGSSTGTMQSLDSFVEYRLLVEEVAGYLFKMFPNFVMQLWRFRNGQLIGFDVSYPLDNAPVSLTITQNKYGTTAYAVNSYHFGLESIISSNTSYANEVPVAFFDTQFPEFIYSICFAYIQLQKRRILSSVKLLPTAKVAVPKSGGRFYPPPKFDRRSPKVIYPFSVAHFNLPTKK
jgi:hypothetical protein